MQVGWSVSAGVLHSGAARHAPIRAWPSPGDVCRDHALLVRAARSIHNVNEDVCVTQVVEERVAFSASL